jgi:hypothetical protein
MGFSISMGFPIQKIDYSRAIITVEGKLRGSRARSLGETLEELKSSGLDGVILDLRKCGSMDSIGAMVLSEALEMGVHLSLIVNPGFRFDEYLFLSPEDEEKILLFYTLKEAVRFAKAPAKKGLMVPGL